MTTCDLSWLLRDYKIDCYVRASGNLLKLAIKARIDSPSPAPLITATHSEAMGAGSGYRHSLVVRRAQ